MPKYKPNRVVHADWWDADEHATFIGTLGFMASQRVSYHVSATRGVTPSTPDEVVVFVGHMVAALLEMLDPAGWALLGRDGAIVPLTEDGLGGLPPEDIGYLFTQAFPSDPDVAVLNAGTPAEEVVYQPDGMITPKAAEVGLHTANFPVQHTTEVAVPGG